MMDRVLHMQLSIIHDSILVENSSLTAVGKHYQEYLANSIICIWTYKKE